MRPHAETTVAADRHARPTGRGEPRAEYSARPEAHAGESPGVQHGLRAARLPELHEPIVMHSGVERDDGIVGQHRAAVRHDALRPQRRGMDRKIWTDIVVPSGAPRVD